VEWFVLENICVIGLVYAPQDKDAEAFTKIINPFSRDNYVPV